MVLKSKINQSFTLSNDSLGHLNQDILKPKYDRALLSPGIIHIGVGNFHRAHQAVYLDEYLNNNKDFSDDSILSFPKNKDESIKNIDSVVEFKYNLNDSVSTNFSKRHIRIFPDSNSIYAKFLKDSLNKSLATSFELMDFMKGQLRIDTLDYDVAIQGFVKNRTLILVKPINISLSDQDKVFNENFYFSLIFFGYNITICI